MMMKIFGAVLIVSGGYLMGMIRTYQWKMRLKALVEVQMIFESFYQEMTTYRRSIDEFLRDKGEVAYCLLRNQPIKGLTQEDHARITDAMSGLKKVPLYSSINIEEEFISYIDETVKKLREDIASTGKALPLVTGAIGLLIAVLLF